MSKVKLRKISSNENEYIKYLLELLSAAAVVIERTRHHISDGDCRLKEMADETLNRIYEEGISKI